MADIRGGGDASGCNGRKVLWNPGGNQESQGKEGARVALWIFVGRGGSLGAQEPSGCWKGEPVHGVQPGHVAETPISHRPLQTFCSCFGYRGPGRGSPDIHFMTSPQAQQVA